MLSPRSRNLQGCSSRCPSPALLAFWSIALLRGQPGPRPLHLRVAFNDPIYVQTIINTLVTWDRRQREAVPGPAPVRAPRVGRRATRSSPPSPPPWPFRASRVLSVRWMMSSQWGILNLISEDLGLGTHHWLASRWTALTALIIFHIWKYLPFWTVIILAARRGIPRQLYGRPPSRGVGVPDLPYISVPGVLRELPHLLLRCSPWSSPWATSPMFQLMTGGAPATPLTCSPPGLP